MFQVLCNGPGTCIPLCTAGLLLGILGLKRVLLVYVESICRVESLSLSGKILYPFADYFFVQWKPLQAKYPKSTYIGRIVWMEKLTWQNIIFLHLVWYLNSIWSYVCFLLCCFHIYHWYWNVPFYVGVPCAVIYCVCPCVIKVALVFAENLVAHQFLSNTTKTKFDVQKTGS